MSSAQPMSTARGVALLRAIEMQRPEAQRLCADPYARSFVNPVTLFSTGLVVRSGLLDRLLPRGTVDFAIVRERYVHDLMVAEIRDGIEQLVILGAGFDTRAYRIPELGSIPVFEVDHPTTQNAKRKALAGVVPTLPAGHRFVAVDFNTQDLGERLAAEGFDENRRTLFVWQGVIMYLTPAGIDATLGFIANHSGPRSTVVFDYFYAGALRGRGSGYLQFMTRAMGERVTFGIEEGKIAPFLEQRDFTDIRNVDAGALRALYRDILGDRPLMAGAAIVSARVVRPTS